MGDANIRMLKEAKTVTIDFAALPLRVSKAFAKAYGLAVNDDAKAIASMLLLNLVGQQYPKGLDRSNGRFWAAWQDMIDDEPIDEQPPQTSFDTTVAVLAWAQKMVADEKLGVPPFLAGPREVFAEHLEQMISEAKAS
jgi:hypothetical protein